MLLFLHFFEYFFFLIYGDEFTSNLTPYQGFFRTYNEVTVIEQTFVKELEYFVL